MGGAGGGCRATSIEGCALDILERDFRRNNMRSRPSISTIVLSALLCILLSFGLANQEPLRGPFSGRVVPPDGKPALNAKVYLVEASLESRVVQETQTD